MKNVNEMKQRREIEAALYNAFTRYCDYQFYGVIAERKKQQRDNDKSEEIVEGMPKPLKEIHWEYIRFKRSSIDSLREYVKLCHTLLTELKAPKQRIIDYFGERGVLLAEDEVKGFEEGLISEEDALNKISGNQNV